MVASSKHVYRSNVHAAHVYASGAYRGEGEDAPAGGGGSIFGGGGFFMNVPLGDTIDFDAILTSILTNEPADATGSVSYSVFEQNNDTPILTGAMTKRTAITGNYRGRFAITSGAGFEIGKYYSLNVSATVSGTFGRTVLRSFRVDHPVQARLASMIELGGSGPVNLQVNPDELDPDVFHLQWFPQGYRFTRDALARILVAVLTQSFRASGAEPTVEQALWELLAHHGSMDIQGTTKRLKDLAGDVAKEFDLNSAIRPTSISESP